MRKTTTWTPARRRTVRLAVARHRRIAAAICVASGTAAALHALAAPPAPTVRVWVAARDLAAGEALSAADLRGAAWPASAVPDGAVAGPAGTLAAPLRRGEPVTDARLLGAGLLAAQEPGTLAVPVRLADSGASQMLRPGDLVDVLASGITGDPAASPIAEVVAAAVRVLAVSGSSEPGWGEVSTGALVVVATSAQEARQIAGAAGGRALSIAVRAG